MNRNILYCLLWFAGWGLLCGGVGFFESTSLLMSRIFLFLAAVYMIGGCFLLLRHVPAVKQRVFPEILIYILLILLSLFLIGSLISLFL